MNINSKKLTFVAVSYCWIGPVIFLLGWVRWYWTLPTVVAILFAFHKYRQDLNMLPVKQPLYISWKVFAYIMIMIFFWTIASGSGGFIGQQNVGDWEKHNMILNDLITYDWPVYYHNGNENAMLTYYIASYLVPAIFGKLFNNFHIAEIVMLINNFIGLLIAALLLLRLVKASTSIKQLITIFIFIFFGTVLFIGRGLYAATPLGSVDIPSGIFQSHWISNTIRLQYPYMSNALNWAFPQVITPWIVSALFVESKKKFEHYLLLATPLLIHATLPFLGIALLMIGYFSWHIIAERAVVINIKRAFSVSNICSALVVLIFLVYLYGNIGSNKPLEISFGLIDYGMNPTLYFCFISTFFCYSVILFDKYKYNILFYLINGILLILPFMKMGLWNDLVMRVSIPAIFILMFFCIDALFFYLKNKYKIGRAAILILLLLCGAYYPVKMVNFTIQNGMGNNKGNFVSLSEWAYRDGSVNIDAAYNYFTYDYPKSLFCRYLARN